MKTNTILIYINLILLLAMAIYVYLRNDVPAVANMPELYNQYNGRKDVEARYVDKMNGLNYLIDSLSTLAEKTPFPEKSQILDKVLMFNQEKDKAELDMQQQIWNQLNQYMLDYGKTHRYKLIFGANNSGNILYSSETVDITRELINYVNQKYAGK